MTSIVPPREKVLWSGGFDSTFLLFSLLRSGVRVEAIYLTQDLGWQKQRRELEARRRILHAMPADLRALLVMPPHDPDEMGEDYWAHFRRIHREMLHENNKLDSPEPFANQCAGIAAVAEVHGKVLTGYVKGDHAPSHVVAGPIMRAHGVEMPMAHKTKAELLAEARALGIDRLLWLTWSCEGSDYEAKDGPCGACDPCKARIVPSEAVI